MFRVQDQRLWLNRILSPGRRLWIEGKHKKGCKETKKKKLSGRFCC